MYCEHTKNESLRLGESDIAPICEGCNTQAPTITNVFILIGNSSIANEHQRISSGRISSVSQLALPLKGICSVTAIFDKTPGDVSGMDVNGAQSDKFLALIPVMILKNSKYVIDC